MPDDYTLQDHAEASGPARLDDARGLLEVLDALPSLHAQLAQQIRRAVVGHDEAVELMQIAALCQGHALVVGVPGLAKTLVVRALAASLDLSFSRIQFTPDMVPADILGGEILETDARTGERRLRFVPGPIFGQVVLADEINRTPPKTQSALLEAMAEGQVSVGGSTRPLPRPFCVFATQNPIEQEGTYPLPEAQLDRFMFGITLGYPKSNAELEVIRTPDAFGEAVGVMRPIFDAVMLGRLRRAIAAMPVSDVVAERALALLRATRPGEESAPGEVGRYVSWGAGPRAGQQLLLASRCLAALEGEPTPRPSHVDRLLTPVLRHRLVLNYEAAAEGVTGEAVLDAVRRSVGAGVRAGRPR